MKLQPNKFEVTCKTADNFFSTRFKFHWIEKNDLW
jgi:hypothetical protein